MSYEAPTPSEHFDVGVVAAGDLVSTGMRAIGGNFFVFAAVALICGLPSVVTSILHQELAIIDMESYDLYADDPRDPYGIDPYENDPYGALGANNPLAQPLFWLVLLLGFIGSYVATAGLMFVTVEWMAGRKVTVGEALVQSVSRLGPVVVISVLSSVASLAGMMLCIVPGVIIALTFIAAVPATVVEKLGPIESMKRSAELTEGHRLQIFVALLAVFAVYMLFSCLGGTALAAGILVSDPSAGSAASVPVGVRVLSYGFEFVRSMIWLIGNSAVAAVFYARVRGIQDGVDARALADVFS